MLSIKGLWQIIVINPYLMVFYGTNRLISILSASRCQTMPNHIKSLESLATDTTGGLNLILIAWPGRQNL